MGVLVHERADDAGGDPAGGGGWGLTSRFSSSVIEIVEMAGGDLGANVIVVAERFPGSFYDLSTAFSGSHKADIQY